MKKIKIDFSKIKQKDYDYIVECLNKGQVLAYPTDTVYGLGCLVNNKKAVSKIFEIKGRLEKKSFILLIKDIEDIKKYCLLDIWQEKLLKKIWPGPITVILKKKKKVNFFDDKETVAFRLPKNDFLITILKELKAPLVSTSLNKSGEKTLSRLDDIENYFSDNKIDLVLDAGYRQSSKPSRIIDIQDINNIKIVR